MFAALVAVALLAPADPPQDKETPLPEAAQKELDKLQGKWKVVLIGRHGKEHKLGKDDPELVGEFKGRRWLFTGVEKAEVVALDPKADPKLIDLKSLEKVRGDDVVDEAIYSLTGDTLTICLYQGKGKNRPAEFDTSKNGDTILLVMDRVKPPKK